MRNHTVVVGYGTKGRSAVSALLADGVHPSQIVVVDTDTHSLDMAAGQGLVTVHGSATKADVLKLAGVTRARAVVVAPNMDDTAVLVQWLFPLRRRVECWGWPRSPRRWWR